AIQIAARDTPSAGASSTAARSDGGAGNGGGTAFTGAGGGGGTAFTAVGGGAGSVGCRNMPGSVAAGSQSGSDGAAAVASVSVGARSSSTFANRAIDG